MLKSNGEGHRAEIRWERLPGSCLHVGFDVARAQEGTQEMELRYSGKVHHHFKPNPCRFGIRPLGNSTCIC